MRHYYYYYYHFSCGLWHFARLTLMSHLSVGEWMKNSCYVTSISIHNCLSIRALSKRVKKIINFYSDGRRGEPQRSWFELFIFIPWSCWNLRNSHYPDCEWIFKSVDSTLRCKIYKVYCHIILVFWSFTKDGRVV